MSRWFRFYDDVVNDPKVLKLPVPLRWAWVALLCVASKNDGRLPAIDDVALSLRVSEVTAAEYITKLVKAKLIDNQAGVFMPHNWGGRQFKSDTSNERVKQHREKKRNVTSKQECNVTSAVTGNVTTAVTVTAPEAEAETEADSEQSRADASAPVNSDLEKRAGALSLLVEGLFRAHGQPVPKLDRCTLWLNSGYQPGQISQAIEKVLKRGKPISTLDYFDGAIKDAHAAPVPSSTLTPVPMNDDDWRGLMKRWKGNNSIWPRGVGGEPGMIGCRCPANIVFEFGIDPATGLPAGDGWCFIEETTPEMGAYCHDAQTRKTKAPVIFEIVDDGVVKRGIYQPTRWPAGYDEATGEKLAPASGEAAA